METFWQDVRFGFRMLVKHPGLSIIATVTFGLGIGLTTAVFSIVNGAMFKGLPFEEADRIVYVSCVNPSRNVQRMRVSVQDYAVYQERQTVFQTMGAFTFEPINLSLTGERAERFQASPMTSGVFDVLRAKPVLGRVFRAEDDQPGADPVILISHDVWLQRFGGAPDVVGKTVRANGVTRTIVGVMPERFGFPDRNKLWIPLVVDPLANRRGQGPSYDVVARLKQGTSVTEAAAQMAGIAAQLEKQFPESNQGVGASVKPFARGVLGPQIFSLLYTMLGAACGVLLIACVNVANLLIARVSLRTREVAVRSAMGASRVRVMMQLMVEVMVLALGGGLLGFALSEAAMAWFLSAITIDPPPFWITFGLDHRVLLFIVGATLAASLFAGLAPALQATRTNISNALKDECRGATGMRMSRFSGGLVVAEVALSCCLLVLAGLMIRSIVQLKMVHMPFATEKVFTARINLPRLQYPDFASRIRFYEALLPKLEDLPGVEAATLSDGLPAAGNGTVVFEVEGQTYGRDSDYPVAREGVVTPGYFRTFQTMTIQGREFTPADRAGNLAVAVVNETFARTFYAKGDAMGSRIRKGRRDPKSQWLTIVGIVPDMLMQGIGNNRDSAAGYYIPIAQSDITNFVSIALRTRGEPMAVTPGVRDAVASLNPDLAIFEALSMRDVIRRQTWFYSIFGTLFMGFGIAALLLAMAGLYGVMSFAVAQRTREMGIRVALGARGAHLMGLVLRKGVIELSLGLLLGLGLALLAVTPVQSLLYHVEPRDPMVLVLVVMALAGSGFAASLIPARLVTRIDPMAALTTE
jgi:putative ABC transport system permease protein